MCSKRDFQDVDHHGDIAEPGSKRARRQTGATPRHQHQNSSIDPTWGQKYVFSSLEDATTIPHGEESDFEDDFEAMAYLQSVRKEAYDIPHLLVAPKVQIGPQLPPSLRDDGERDGEDRRESDRGSEAAAVACSKEPMQGYYDDGAYIAMPDEDWKVEAEDGQDDSDAEASARVKRLHESYFSSLTNKYRRLRRLLHSKHPADWAERLSSAHVTHAAPFGRNSNTNKVWAKLMRSTDPHPLQLALMSKETVIRALRVLMGGAFLRRGHTLSERTSQWVWGLLARLPERGELNHTEIGCIRDLGRQAVLLGVSLEQMAAMREALREDELDENEGFDADSSDEDDGHDEDEDEDEDEDDDGGGAAVPAESEGQHDHVQDATDNHAADAPQHKQQQSKGGRPGTHDNDSTQPAYTSTTANDDKPEQEKKPQEQEQGEEEGEIQDQSPNGDDIAMEIDSGSEDGHAHDKIDHLEAAKSSLLARLDAASAENHDWEETPAQQEARLRLRINMRATLSMILTIAGEFYGQRDLLEFRNPFLGM